MIKDYPYRTKDEIKEHLKRVQNISLQITHDINDLLIINKDVIADDITFSYDKDFSSYEYNYDLSITLKPFVGSIEYFSDDMKSTRDLVDEEFNHYTERIEIREGRNILHFSISKEFMEDHPIFKSRMAINKFRL